MLGIMAGMDQKDFSACARLGLLVFDDVPRAVLLLVVSGPRCPSSWPAWTTGQLCGSSQVPFLDKVSYMPVGVLCVASWFRQCRKLFGDSTGAAHHHGRRLSHGPFIQQIIEISLSFVFGGRCPCLQVHIPVVVLRQIPWSRLSV